MSNNFVQYNHEDAEVIKKRFPVLSPELIGRLCKWLKDNCEYIEATTCYDSQSGWSGVDFKIRKANLSVNGYCLSNNQIELFLEGANMPEWYYFWTDEV